MTEPDGAPPGTTRSGDRGDQSPTVTSRAHRRRTTAPPPIRSRPTAIEGPRRRARRERAERRAAQARATAIEEARREAKRAGVADAAATPKPVARGVVRGLKMLL